MANDRTPVFLTDAQSLQTIVQRMDSDSRKEYESYGALVKEASFPNRKMVVYTLEKGRPKGISVLTLGDLSLEWPESPKVDVTDESGTEFVSVTPFKWRDRDLFIQVPQHFELKWTGKRTENSGIQFVPHYAMLFKTRGKEFHQVEGHTYCVTLNRFRERFPDVPLRY